MIKFNIWIELTKRKTEQLLEQVKELLGRASSIVATNPELWRSYGDLEEALGNTGKVFFFLLSLLLLLLLLFILKLN